jgi:hypothetical protein
MWHAWERGERCTGFWWESPKGKDDLKDQGVDGRIVFRGMFWCTCDVYFIASVFSVV